MGSKSKQYIQSRVRDKSRGLEFMFIAVYGLHTVHDRLKLREDLRDLAVNAQGPMLCMGDYNAIVKADDRPQGRPIHDMRF